MRSANSRGRIIRFEPSVKLNAVACFVILGLQHDVGRCDYFCGDLRQVAVTCGAGDIRTEDPRERAIYL